MAMARPDLRDHVVRLCRGVSALPGWARVVERLCPPAPKGSQFVASFFGYKYLGDLHDWIDRQAFFFGAYERAQLTYLRSLIPARGFDVVMDVGANSGHHALFFAAFARQVHAFEPSQDQIARFNARMELAGVKHVRLHPVGLWSHRDVLKFHMPTSDNSGLGTFVEEESVRSVSDVRELPVDAGDAIVNGLQIDGRVDFIKIDVQGGERQVLSGLVDTLRRHRPMLWIEVSNAQGGFNSLAALQAAVPYPIGRIVRFQSKGRAPWRRMQIADVTEEDFKDPFYADVFILPEQER